MNTKTKYLFALLTALFTISLASEAATITYTRQPKVVIPTYRRGYHAYPPPACSFTVDAAVVATGTVNWTDVQDFTLILHLPWVYYYTLNGGSMTVDPETGAVLVGGLECACPYASYYYPVVDLEQYGLYSTLGGIGYGSWGVTYNP